MPPYNMTINGTDAPTSATFDVVNPATGEVFGSAPECGRELLDAAFESASKAYRDWKSDESARRSFLSAAADACFAVAEDLGPTITAEQGKPLSEAKAEVAMAGMGFKYHAELELPREVIQDDEKAFAEVVRRPLGVVAAITPWNFPFAMAALKMAPALRAGNTMVLKPSPYTPLSTLQLGSLLASVLPPGVLNVISGGDELGKWMTLHPVPRKVSFTGSVTTGKHVAAAAAPDLKRVTLELGGNDAAIIVEDADPAAIAHDLFWGAFANNGQVCCAIKRVYVPESLEDELVEALVAEARAVRVGNGSDLNTQLGPINNKPQFDRVSGLVADAVSSGATAVAGGAPIDGPGYFFQPTILTGLSEGTRIVDEEQFGPALPIISYRDIDDAVERANATHFGLSGSVWGTDSDRAADIAARMECGTAWVNTHLVLQLHQPFGGAKWSGIGAEGGPWGLYGQTELQVLYRARQ